MEIVERLRDYAIGEEQQGHGVMSELLDDAATEIERLRDELQQASSKISRMAYRLADAQASGIDLPTASELREQIGTIRVPIKAFWTTRIEAPRKLSWWRRWRLRLKK